jgi:hypothetical protein
MNKEHALEYLRLGFSVIPTRGKKPLVEWRQYSQEKPTERQVIEWWNKWTDADIASPTGNVSGIVVVDVDGGKIPSLPNTVFSETSQGHYQYFFKHPSFPIANSVKVVEENIDIRGDGGFVVLPPSRHFNKETGEQDFTYRWVNAPQNTAFADLPSWILEKIKEKKPIEALVQGSSQGSRNNDAASVIGSLLARYPQSEWESVCWSFVEAWNTKNNPPLSYNELRSVFNSIASRQASKPPRQNVQPFGYDTDLSRGSADNPQVSFSFNPLPLSQLTQDESPVEWVWEGFIAKKHITLFSALWKAGKTTLIANLLKAIQEERALAGKDTYAAKILILSEESNVMWARRRTEHAITLPVWISSRPIRQKLNYKEWIYLLEKATQFCKENNIEVLIIDTLSAFWSVDNENDAAKVQAALLPINHLLDNNIAVLLVHHFRKSGGDEGVAARGSGALGAGVDILIEFTRLDSANPNSTERLIKTYSRFEESPREVVIDYVENDHYITVGTRAELRRSEKLETVKRALEDYPSGVTLSELHEKWNSEEFDKTPSKKSLERYVKELVSRGEVFVDGLTRVNGGGARRYRLIAPVSDNLPLTEHAEVVDKQVAIEQARREEKELRLALQGKDKNSQEYAEIYKKWVTSREKGVELGAFQFFVPSPNE